MTDEASGTPVASWPSRRSEALAWLVNGVADQPFLDNLFVELCERLRASDVPLDRATLHLRTLHPQFGGATIRWVPGSENVVFTAVDRGVWQRPDYLRSPLKPLYEGEVEGIRARLDLPTPEGAPTYAIYDDLRAEGLVDYVALPMQFVSGTRHACTWATRQSGGFTTAQLQAIADLLPVLAMVTEIRLNRRITKNILEAYVGKRSGARILAGEIDRGTGETIAAAIWHCDLRGFTMLSERWPRDDVIASLNAYFDTMAAPVVEAGGEILKFIGDAMLAIFPMDEERACERAFRAALDADAGMAALNAERRAAGQDELAFGLALHVGDVMWGNIGAQQRLDFTVIGPAVNVASRLDELSKELRRPLVVSGDFAGRCSCAHAVLERLGSYPLRGVEQAVEVFAPLPDARQRLAAITEPQDAGRV
jgi:adenylate cyclase